MTTAMRSGQASQLVGRAAAFIEASGSEIRFCDLYDQHGAWSYHLGSLNDPSEIFDFVQILRTRPGAALELAAGSGRLTLPLVAAGNDITALDNSDAMLDILRARIAQAPAALGARCTVVCQDMANFDLDATFESIILGSTSVTLLGADQRATMLASVASHLAPGGVFYLSVPIYESDEAIHDTHQRIDTDEGSVDLFSHLDAIDGHRTVTCVALAGDGVLNVAISRPKKMSRAELDGQIKLAGLKLVASRRSVAVEQLDMTSELLELTHLGHPRAQDPS